jgi:hypothetical protein
VALATLAGCTVDDRTIAPSQDVDANQAAGAGGAPIGEPPGPAAGGGPPIEPVDTNEGNPDVSGMIAAGGGDTSGNGESTTPVTEPVAPTEPPAMEEPAAAPVTINGRVVDAALRPLANLPVTIDGTTVATNAAGQFSIAGVTAPYTASLTVTTRNGVRAHYGYVFEGLTRLDPTLQVHGGQPGRSANINFALQNADFSIAEREAIFALGTPDRLYVRSLTNLQTSSPLTPWTGPATTAGTAHGLLVVREEESTFSPIVAYEAHRTTAVALSEGVTTTISLDLSPTPITTSTISGSVSTSGIADDRENRVSVRFDDGVELPLLDDIDAGDTFSYLVPVLDGASLRVVAIENDGFVPIRAAHRDNIAPGQVGIALAIPNSVTPTSPTNGAIITPDTPFTWSTFGQTATTFVWHLEFVETFEGIYIITNRTSVTLPEFADGLTVPPNTPVYWSVETHGDQPDVDAATGPNGFMDAMAQRGYEPEGANLGDGYFTESEQRNLTIAP